MNSIATLLNRLSARPVSELSPNDARGRNAEDALEGDKGKSGSFDAVLSGLSQNSSGDQKAPRPAAPRVSHIASMTGEASTVTTGVKTATSSSSLTDSAKAVATPAMASGAEASYTESNNTPVRGSTTVSTSDGSAAANASCVQGAKSPMSSPAPSDSGAAALTSAEAGVTAAPNQDVDPTSAGMNQTMAAHPAPVVPATNAPAQNMPPAAEVVATNEAASTNAGQLGVQNSVSENVRTAGTFASLPQLPQHSEKADDEPAAAATLSPPADDGQAVNAGTHQPVSPATKTVETSARASDNLPSANVDESGRASAASGQELTAATPVPGGQPAADINAPEQDSTATAGISSSTKSWTVVVPATKTGPGETSPTIAAAVEASDSIVPSAAETVPHHSVKAGDPQGGLSKAEVRHEEQADKPAGARSGTAIVDSTASADETVVIPSVQSDIASSTESLSPVVPAARTSPAETSPTIAAAAEVSDSIVPSAAETVPHHSVKAGDPQGGVSKAEVRHEEQADKPAGAPSGTAIVDSTASAALAVVAPSVQSDTANAEPVATDAAMSSGVDATIQPASVQGGARSARASASAAGSDRDGMTGDVQAPVTSPGTGAATTNAATASGTEETPPQRSRQLTGPAINVPPTGTEPADNPGRTEATAPDLAAATFVAAGLAPSQIEPSAVEVTGTSAAPNAHIEASRRRSAPGGEHATAASAATAQSAVTSVGSENTAIADSIVFAGSAAVTTEATASIPPESVSAPVNSAPTESTARSLQMHVERQVSAASASASTPPAGVGPDAIQTSNVSSANPDGRGHFAPMSVTAVSSATHFAPVARLSPVQQIGDAVIAVLPSPSIASSSAASSQEPATADASSAVSGTASQSSVITQLQPAPPAIQMLNLQLEPNSLGVVTITLNLSANGLDVQVAADRPATMDLIERDKQALTDQLRQSGYSVAGVAVNHGGPNVADGGSATQNQGSQNATSGGNQAMSHGGSSNGNSSPQSGAQNGLDRGANSQEALGGSAGGSAGSAARGSGAGDLYI